LEVLKESLLKFNPKAPVLVSHHAARGLRYVRTQKKLDIEFLKGKKVNGFCGIGNPRAFHGLLVHLGAQVTAFHAFRDHFRYNAEIVELMIKEAKLLGCEALVTTQKDGVKLRDIKNEFPIIEVLVEVKVAEGRKELESKLAVLLEGH
jgi:tetraacyldisaccharide 4'-kinase